jgi:hypothetical protein
MKVTHLPILSADTLLKDAVKAMRIQQRSAVVREDPAKLHLVKIARICTALGHHQSKLSNVNITEPVYRPTPADINKWHLDTLNPENTGSDWETFLDDKGYSYAVVDAFLSTALIVTRHEPKADAIELKPENCYCEGPYEHSIPPHSIVPVKMCSSCSEPVNCLSGTP